MPYIEIRTSHNVPIYYEIAKLSDRILAYFIDMAILGIGSSLLAGLFSVVFSSEAVVGLVFVLCFAFYTLLGEVFLDGRSVGKMAMGIRVIKLTGREATINDYLVRWVFRLVDIYLSLGSMACILAGSSNKGQRLGDILANTTVVRYKTRSHIRVSNLLSINSRQNYTPQYPEAKNLGEDNALLVKTVVARYQKYPNPGNRENIDLLFEKLVEELGIEHARHNSIDFLQVIVKDYVALSR